VKNSFLILGLGNPGLKYVNTRHNIGFMAVDRLAEKLGVHFRKPFFRPYQIADVSLGESRYILVKPLTYMNRSGDILPRLLRKYKITPPHVYAIVDNMDLPVGRGKIKTRGSSAGHNGLKSLMGSLQRDDFVRFYLGVGRPPQGRRVVEHVLGEFSSQETPLLNEILDKTVIALLALSQKPLSRIQQDFHRL